MEPPVLRFASTPQYPCTKLMRRQEPPPSLFIRSFPQACTATLGATQKNSRTAMSSTISPAPIPPTRTYLRSRPQAHPRPSGTCTHPMLTSTVVTVSLVSTLVSSGRSGPLCVRSPDAIAAMFGARVRFQNYEVATDCEISMSQLAHLSRMSRFSVWRVPGELQHAG